MNKHFKYSILITLLVMITMIAAGPVFAFSTGGNQPQPYESSPQSATATNVGLPPPNMASSYDGDLDTESNFYLTYFTGSLPVPDGIVEWNTFENTPPATFSIAWVDLKIKYRVPTATVDDTYRIEYRVDPNATWFILQPDVAGEKFDRSGSSRARPWANLAEPNDGAWSWTDIANLRVRVYCVFGGLPPDNQKMFVAEVWLSIYDVPPPVMSPTMSVMPMHIPQAPWDWDLIFIDIYVRDVTSMLGFTAIVDFDPAVLWPGGVMVYYPFETAVIEDIGTGYVSLNYVTFYGDGIGFSGDTPIARIWFYPMIASAWSDFRLTKHDIVDILGRPIVNTAVEGDYNKPTSFMSYQGSLLPPGDPTGSRWHELYPTYSEMWTLTRWGDQGDGNLTASDQIEMVRDDGIVQWFHVDLVTITIHFTFKAPDVGEAAVEPTEPVITDEVGNVQAPIGTHWHMIYPEYSREFVITSHEDTNLDGYLNPSEQFDFEFIDEPGVPHWAHLDSVTTDIILSKKPQDVPEFPLGIGLIMLLAPILPLAYIWRLRRKVTKQ